ncbi:hypothetical protein [Serratia marcescens]|uniref:hypothetical protein n=1 Tax=Serratia marcescens TaxID=615 RepID=UPI0011F18EB3|nr:hypothetical protein [Serratia marcescens]
MSTFHDEATRLNNDQFMALRSIAREPWDIQQGRIQWHFSGKWFHLFRQYGIRASLESVDGIGGCCGFESVYEQALDAARILEGRGLVEVFTLRCCPNTPCHRNDRYEFRLTARGEKLLRNANHVCS